MTTYLIAKSADTSPAQYVAVHSAACGTLTYDDAQAVAHAANTISAANRNGFDAAAAIAAYPRLVEVLRGVDFAAPAEDLDFHGEQDDVSVTMTAAQWRHIRALLRELGESE